jgi:hypothetical protein
VPEHGRAVTRQTFVVLDERRLALPTNLASRRLWATRLLNVLATFPPRLNNFLVVTVLVVSYLKEKSVAIGFSYRMEKLKHAERLRWVWQNRGTWRRGFRNMLRVLRA